MRAQRTRHLHAPLVRAAFAIALGWLLAFAGAAPAAAQININISNPSSSTPQADPLGIFLYVTSPSEVTSVQAAVGSRTTALTHGDGVSWSGSLSLAGLPRGEHQLVITATNAAAETQQATRTFTYDNLPTLTVTAPADYTLGTPDVRVAASCADDGPTCRITVFRIFPAFDPQEITQFIPLAVGDGSTDTLIRSLDGARQLQIRATDSTGRWVAVTRNITTHADSRLRSSATFSGTILDITSDRALIYEDTATPPVVRIVDRATNTSQIIWTNTRYPPAHVQDRLTQTALTASGALFVTREFVGEFPQRATLHEWRGGTLTNLGVIQYSSLRINGSWAIYAESVTAGFRLVVRNLLTGTNAVVADHWDAAGGYTVAPDGRVFYVDDLTKELVRWEPGTPPTTTPMTSAAPARSFNPASDGVNLVFSRTPQSSYTPVSTILRTADGTEIVLAVGKEVSYLVANGWVAFIRPDNGGTLQPWLRAPDGTERQLGVTVGARIESLSDTGEVIFGVFPSFVYPATRRYLARADGTVVDLGAPPIGTLVRLDGVDYTFAGAHLFAVDTQSLSRSILSEGATGTFFTTDVAILNPHNSAVPVTIRYLRENAPAIEQTRTLPALSRTTIRENDIPGLEGTSVSTMVDAPSLSPVVVERLMTWDASGYGGHLGSSVERPRPRWLFAEGAQGFFHTFFLLANSDTSEASVRFTFLIEQGTPVTYTVKVAPGARKTIAAGDIADLINRSFATVIESDVPIVAERAMYFGDSPAFLGGHGSAGTPEPAHIWYHAEGATGPLFDTFILLANPHPVDVVATVNYTTDTGVRIDKTHTLPASSRLTINIEDEAPELANVAVSTRVWSASFPIVSERAMYWGTTGTGWREAHNSFGITTLGTKWGLAEGRSGGPRAYQTFVLVSNIFSTAADVRVTFVKEDGTTVVRTFRVADQRFTIDTGAIPELANSNFSTIVESTNNVQISVESAIYWSVNGVIWEGGGNTVATRLP